MEQVIVALINDPKTDQEWAIWSYHHRLSHDAIRQAIEAQKKINLTDYQVDPISPHDIGGFLQRNQQAHLEMDHVLGLPSQDLQDVNLGNEAERVAWVQIHWLEHNDAEIALGI